VRSPVRSAGRSDVGLHHGAPDPNHAARGSVPAPARRGTAHRRLVVELLRRAVDATYKPTDVPLEDKLRILEETAGLWSDEQAEEFLEQKRALWEARRKRLEL